MADHYIENEEIKIGINLHGAELVSLVRKSDEREYMWCGDSAYWGRVSPVLFPFVGKLNGAFYTHNGVTFEGVPQHGWARDSEFVLVEQLDDTIWFELRPDEVWKGRYPYEFVLRIGYRIEGKNVHVMWNVINNSDETMYFSIGAHPAFNCPVNGEDNKNGYSLDLHTNSTVLESGLLNNNGCVTKTVRNYDLVDGKLMLTERLFDDDALIVDSNGINTVSIVDPEGNDYLSVKFDTPLLGIWSPAKKNAPFVCIEPWYGRSDKDDFEGDLKDREFGNMLEAGHSFCKEYVICI